MGLDRSRTDRQATDIYQAILCLAAHSDFRQVKEVEGRLTGIRGHKLPPVIVDVFLVLGSHPFFQADNDYSVLLAGKIASHLEPDSTDVQTALDLERNIVSRWTAVMCQVADHVGKLVPPTCHFSMNRCALRVAEVPVVHLDVFECSDDVCHQVVPVLALLDVVFTGLDPTFRSLPAISDTGTTQRDYLFRYFRIEYSRYRLPLDEAFLI